MGLKKIIVGALVLLLITNSLKAQTSTCEQILNQAVQEFSAGHFYGIPSLLGPCVNKLTKEQSIRAYLLLTQVYMVIDDPNSADESYLKLLRIDPEFQATEEKDPIDIVYLSKKFTTRPIFTPHFSFGTNVSLARILADVNSDPISVVNKQSLGLGFQMALGVEWNFSDHFSIGSSFRWGTKNFKSTRTGLSFRDEVQILENQNCFDIPIYLKYHREFKKFRPFIYSGFSVNNLLSASGVASFKNANESGISVTSDGSIPLLYKRNHTTFSLVFGFGAKYKVSRNYLAIDFQYMKGLNNLTKISSNYYDADGQSMANSITQYRQIGDLFTLDSYSISVSYLMPLYHPRKIKKVQSIDFINKIFKRKKNLIKG